MAKSGTMSLTMQQIICDAERLASRLKEQDAVADSLLTETHAINKRIDAMKQFQEEVDHLNEVANQKPHSQLIANIQKEHRHLREIQQENRELKSALEDYHFTLEHIMSKYREHTHEQVYKSRINLKALTLKKYEEIIRQQAEKIEEMAAVMRKAASLDEDQGLQKLEEVITQLKVENQVCTT